ncbi:MAG: DUF484 family protein [Azoarcus sp.]|jgi:uncharacterized protein YigA (DUF484 family)|nr:DUF484 family protein [Azoarcus sp.]
MNAEEVIRYLREHPGFLGEHSDLLSVLTVPHPRHKKAISLTERQLHDLRGKIRQLEQKLAELLQFGDQNDEISAKVHRLAIALLEAEAYDSARRALFDSLRDDFSVPHAALRIWGAGAGRDGEEFSPVSEDVRRYAADMTRPCCGAPGNAEVLEWFGEMGPHIRSVALMPLRRGGETAGLLALGSEEAERFYNEMGTLYLERIGALAAVALLGEIERP